MKLSSLPIEHPLRNAPLISIKAKFRWVGAKYDKGWRSVGEHWKIANKCFNDLGSAWTEYSEWHSQID